MEETLLYIVGFLAACNTALLIDTSFKVGKLSGELPAIVQRVFNLERIIYDARTPNLNS